MSQLPSLSMAIALLLTAANLVLAALPPRYEGVHQHGFRSHFTHNGTCGDHSKRCVPPLQCPDHILRTSEEQPKFCALPSGSIGICCDTGMNSTGITDRPRANLPSKTDMRRMARDWQTEARRLMAQEAAALEPGTPSFGHYLQVRGEPGSARDMAQALQGIVATRAVRSSQQLSGIAVTRGALSEPGTAPFCPPEPACSINRYRHLDGACNNLLHPRWGMARAPLSRLLALGYSDGIWTPRTSAISDTELPSARVLSTTLFRDRDRPHHRGNLILMQFGQFVAHDIILSPSITKADGSSVSCCTRDGIAVIPEDRRHFACMPIQVSPHDPFYRHFGRRCLNFVRSILAPRYDCSLGIATQMNQVTHFVDGSSIYGTSSDQLTPLRTFDGGLLLVFTDFGRDLPPQSTDRDACLTTTGGSACFQAGDARANQMLALVAFHTLFLREHNRLARLLSGLNPAWTDEEIFQEARHIVVAELQHILYSEWLPLVVGAEAMDDFKLSPKGGHTFDYDVRINPSISNEFSSAAFRFGHSIVDGRLRILDNKTLDELVLIPDVMLNPGKMRRREFLDRLLMTMSWQPMQSPDLAVSVELTRYMFRGGRPFGVDLAAINIQRGRDHGLAPYSDYRMLLGLPRPKDFEDLVDPIPVETVERLATAYSHPDDVDLYVGGLGESPVHGALLGPVFLNIIADQFSRLRRGDRFFYRLGGLPSSFSKAQLAEIMRVTMARIICDNADGIELVNQSPHAFLRSDRTGNEPVSCDSTRIPHMNLLPWKEF